MDHIQNIIALAKQGTDFRRELITNRYSQVVIMSVEPGQDIGMEVHDLDQILVFIDGEGEAVIEGEKAPIGEGSLFVVPAGAEHNFINTGSVPLKLFTVYAPAEHAKGTVHRTKAEADAAEHHH
ncbi:MAG: cupin domain-containing protein [Alphaproteobacteria bacterium]